MRLHIVVVLPHSIVTRFSTFLILTPVSLYSYLFTILNSVLLNKTVCIISSLLSPFHIFVSIYGLAHLNNTLVQVLDDLYQQAVEEWKSKKQTYLDTITEERFTSSEEEESDSEEYESEKGPFEMSLLQVDAFSNIMFNPVYTLVELYLLDVLSLFCTTSLSINAALHRETGG